MGVRGYFLPKDEYEEVRRIINHQGEILGVKSDDNTDNSGHKPRQ